MKLSELQARFQAAKVLVVGDLMLDEYLLGTVSRISPEAPVPVLDVKSRTHVAGGAANVAVNIRTLSGVVTLVGMVSGDAAGEHLRRILGGWGVSLSGLVDSGARGTICKTRIIAGQQQIVRIDHEDRSVLSMEVQAKIAATTFALLPEHDICVLSDYAKGTLSDSVCKSVIESAKAFGKPVIVDPKGKLFQKYRGCSIITPNLNEAAVAVGISIEDQHTLLEAGRQLMVALPGTRVLITRGADGMTLFSDSYEPITVPALARRVFDVVGAGDTVVATLALALGSGLSSEVSMRLATVAASIVVGKPGTATTTIKELFENEDYDRVVQQSSAIA